MYRVQRDRKAPMDARHPVSVSERLWPMGVTFFGYPPRPPTPGTVGKELSGLGPTSDAILPVLRLLFCDASNLFVTDHALDSALTTYFDTTLGLNLPDVMHLPRTDFAHLLDGSESPNFAEHQRVLQRFYQHPSACIDAHRTDHHLARLAKRTGKALLTSVDGGRAVNDPERFRAFLAQNHVPCVPPNTPDDAAHVCANFFLGHQSIRPLGLSRRMAHNPHVVWAHAFDDWGADHEEVSALGEVAAEWCHRQGYRGLISVYLDAPPDMSHSPAWAVAGLEPFPTPLACAILLSAHLAPNATWQLARIPMHEFTRSEKLLDRLDHNERLFTRARNTGVIPLKLRTGPEGVPVSGLFICAAPDKNTGDDLVDYLATSH